MKKLLSILLLGLLLFTLASCTDDDEGSNSGFPTDPDDTWNGSYDLIMVISKNYTSDDYVYIEFRAFEEPDDWDFELDGEDLDIDDDDWYEEGGGYYGYDEFWYCEINGNNLDIDFDAGDKIDYELEFNGKTYEGELEILAELDVDWDDFDFDEDFEFDWDIDEDPMIYNIFSYGEFEEDDEYEYFDKSWQIDGSENEFSITKSLYDDYEDWEYWWTYFHIWATNYVNHGKCLTWTETGESNQYGYGTQKQFDPKERAFRTLEMFKQKFNK